MLRGCLCNSFFPRKASLWNSLPIECFPLTYNLNGFRFFLKRFPVRFNICVLLFLVTPCLVVAVQPCKEWTQSKKNKNLAKPSYFYLASENLVSCTLSSFTVYLGPQFWREVCLIPCYTEIMLTLFNKV